MKSNSKGTAYDFDSVRLAGFWIRTLARLVDGLILGIILLIMWLLIYLTFDAELSSFWDVYLLIVSVEEWTAVIVLYFLIYSIIYFSYYVVMNAKYGQTLGKIMTGLEIRDYDNLYELSIGKTIGRFFALELFSWIPLVNILNFAWAGFDPNKQTWHDKLARTLVVYKESLTEEPEVSSVGPTTSERPSSPSMGGKEFGELIFTKGMMATKHYTLRGRSVLVGRKSELVHVTVNDPEKRISRIQCEIFEVNGRYKLRNRASVASTFLNGKALKEDTFLRSDDRIGFGSHEAKIIFF